MTDISFESISPWLISICFKNLFGWHIILIYFHLKLHKNANNPNFSNFEKKFLKKLIGNIVIEKMAEETTIDQMQYGGAQCLGSRDQQMIEDCFWLQKHSCYIIPSATNRGFHDEPKIAIITGLEW